MSNAELKVSLFPLKYAIAYIEIIFWGFFGFVHFFRLFWGEKAAVCAIDLAKAPKKCPVVGQKPKIAGSARKTPYSTKDAL
jgi:hypothetical protein